MKRLFVALLFLAVPLHSFAWEVIGSGVTTADYCADKLGSYSLYYDADHPGETTTACISGGTTTATFTGVTASDTVNSTPGGTYGVLWDGTINKNLSLPSIGLTSGNGRVEFRLVTSDTLSTSTNAGLWEWYSDASNYITVRAKYSGATIQIVATHRKDAVSITTQTAYSAVATNTSYPIIADWNATTGKITIQFDGGTVAQNASGTVSAFASEPSGVPVKFGEDLYTYSHGQSIGLDDVRFRGSAQ